MKITIKDIAKVLKKAGSIKDRIEPLCSTALNYPRKKNGYLMCAKCYPIQPERLSEKTSKEDAIV